MHRLIYLSACLGFVGANAGPSADFLIKGLVAPVFTPMTDDGGLDVEQIPALAKYLNATGVHWIFSSGTTGESVDLTVSERKTLAEAWVRVAKEYGQRVIVHVGTDSVEDAKSLADHAQYIGADAIAAMPPTYIKPASVSDLVSTMAVIAAAAPDLPFYYYHIPSMTGVTFKMLDFLRAADGHIPTFRGIKFTDHNMDDFQFCMEYSFAASSSFFNGSKANMLFGRDQFMLSAAVLGCQAAVGSTYNWNGELQNMIFAGVAAGDYDTARVAQLASARFINEVTATESAMYAFKTVMEVIPGLPSMGPPRLPYKPASAQAKEKLRAAVQAWCAETPTKVRPSYCQSFRPRSASMLV